MQQIMSSFDYHPYIPQLIRDFKASLKSQAEELGGGSWSAFPSMVLIDYAYSQEICILSMLLVEDVLTTYSVSAKIQAFNLLSHLPRTKPTVNSPTKICRIKVSCACSANNSTRRVPPITCPGLRVGVQAQHHHHRLYRDSCHHLIYNKHPRQAISPTTTIKVHPPPIY